MDYINSDIEKIHRERKYCVIMGDFNIDLLKYEEHHQSDDFINTLGIYSFQPHILQPTRITAHSATLIDNIFFNSIDHNLISGNLICDISDNLPNFLLIYNMPTSQCRTGFYVRDYSKLNETALYDEIKLIDWREILSHCYGSNLIFIQLFQILLISTFLYEDYHESNLSIKVNHG